MKTHYEIEFKTMISRDDYFRLKETIFKNGLLKEQSNVYFDTQSKYFFDKKQMIRIRKYTDHALFTWKIPKDNEKLIEKEFIIESSKAAQEKINQLLTPHNLTVHDLYQTAQSHTTRIEIKDTWGVWCLDHSQFDQHEDFELEYELFEEIDMGVATRHFFQMLEKYEVQFKRALPKYIRALSHQKG